MFEQPLEDRLGLVQALAKEIGKKYGKNTMITPAEAPEALFEKQILPTGILQVDRALLIGGFPRGSIIEIYGQEHSCKTLLALKHIAAVQKLGGIGVFVDLEWAFDEEWAVKQGVNPNQLYIIRAKTAEEALDTTLAILRKAPVDVIVLDSAAALLPSAEAQRSMEDGSLIGARAKMLDEFIRKSLRNLYDSENYAKSTLVFINQLRDKIASYGAPTTTPGGRALKFYAKIRLELAAGEPIKSSGGQVGVVINGKVKKCKVSGAAGNTFNFRMLYGKGVDTTHELLVQGMELGIITKGGPWYRISHPELELAEDIKVQGEIALTTLLEENSELTGKIRDLCYRLNLSKK